MTNAAVPPRPDPWATTQPREAMRDTNAGRIVCLAPSVNLTPIGSSMVPVPYQVVDFTGHDGDYSPDVFMTKQKAMRWNSITEHVHGDSAGTGGGVKSGTVGGICEPIEHAAQVRANGSHLMRDGDRCWMNNRNTQGECTFVRDTGTYAPPKDGDPIPGSASTALAGAGASGLLQDVRYLDPTPQVTATAPSVAPTTEPGLEPGRPGMSGGFGAWVAIIGGGIVANEAGQTARQYLAGDDAKTALGVINDPGNATTFGSGLNGKQAGDSLAASGNMGPSVSDQALVDDANARLSLKAGRPVDFREMSPEQIEELNRRPWPPAEQIRDTASKLQQQKDKEAKRQAELMPAPGDNARISEDKRERRCKVGPYSEMNGYCSKYGMQAHHIVPDYALRYGTRSEGEKGEKRIPGLPTFGQGMSICVTGNAKLPKGYEPPPGNDPDPEQQHAIAHEADKTIAEEGAANTPAGTLPMKQIVATTVTSATKAKKECAPEIAAKILEQYKGRDPLQLGRATPYDTPKGDALAILPGDTSQTPATPATTGNWQNILARKAQ